MKDIGEPARAWPMNTAEYCIDEKLDP